MKFLVTFLLPLSILSVVSIAHAETARKIVLDTDLVPSTYSFTQAIDGYGSRTTYGGTGRSYSGGSSKTVTLSNASFANDTDDDVYFKFYEVESSSVTITKSDYFCTNSTDYPVVELQEPEVNESDHYRVIPIGDVYCQDCNYYMCD